MKTLLQI